MVYDPASGAKDNPKFGIGIIGCSQRFLNNGNASVIPLTWLL